MILDVPRNTVASQASVLFITVSPVVQGVLCTVTPIQGRKGGGGWCSWWLTIQLWLTISDASESLVSS